MSATWIMVANSSIARFFLMEKNGSSLTEIETLVHSASRLHGRDLKSDGPGRTQESSTRGRHATDPDTLPQEVQFETFARTLANHLELAKNENKYDRLIIAASPHFLGLLRQNLRPNTTKILEMTIDKDLTHMNPKEIKEQVMAKA